MHGNINKKSLWPSIDESSNISNGDKNKNWPNSFFYNIYGIIYIRLLDGFKMKSIPFHIIRNKDKPSIDAIIIFK